MLCPYLKDDVFVIVVGFLLLSFFLSFFLLVYN